MKNKYRPLTWAKDGIAKNKVGLVAIKFGNTYSCYTHENLRHIILSFDKMEGDLLVARQQFANLTPSLFIPEAIRQLEANADKCDEQGWLGQAMAYRDAAALLRKGVK